MMAAAVYGQAVNGTLLGNVNDASGASVPNARVSIIEENTGVNRNSETNVGGLYTFADLPPGIYTVSVEVQGFKKAVRTKVEVQVNSTIRADFSLQPGNVSESISVTAEAPLLQTDRSDTGRKIETKQLADLPLGGNRNFQALLNLVPGTTRAFRPHSVFFNSQDSLSTQVNGQGRLANNVQFEGVDNNQRTGLNTVLIPPIEALQSVDVTTSNYEAELGRAAGAVTNLILKSGTNEFHGSAYEFNQVSRLAARNFFTPTKPVTTYNYFGATFGGPIVRNRAFFFGDFLKIYDRRGQSDRVTVPTAEFRSGNLSASPTIIYDPDTGTSDGANRIPFAGNIIPTARIKPLAQKVLALIPLPNQPGLANNFVKNTTLQKDTDSFDAKVDDNPSDRDRVSVRYSFQRPVVTDPPLFGLAGGPHGGGFQGTGINKTQSAAINYNHLFSPTLITEARFGVSRYRNTAQATDYGTNASADLGVPGVNIDPWASGLFAVEIGGYSNPIVGYSASLPWVRAETNFNLVNTWTKTMGRHTIKWGADIRRLRDELLQTQTFNPRGVFRYNEGTTSCRTGCTGSTTQGFGNSFASFLLDLPNTIGRDLPVIFPAWRQWQFFLFAQDKVQLTSKLTLDLGLRWEYYKPATPRKPGGFSQYDPNTNSLLLAGVGDVPMDLGIQSNYANFAPRLGIAYRFTEKTVIRAGYGISYSPFPDNTYAYNYPVKQNNAYNQPNSYAPAVLPDGRNASLANGFPPPQVVQIPSNGIITSAPLNQVYDVINPKFREPYVQSWNLAVQRTLPWNFVWESAYVGNHGVRIPIQYNLNAGLVLGAGNAGRPLFAKFGRSNDTNLRYVGQSTNYHSLQTKFDRRFKNGFMLTSAYTYGKAIGWVDETGGYAYYINPERSRARQSFDRTHIFTQSYIYDLPFGKGKQFLSSGWASQVLGNWQVNGILTLMSGTPLNFTYSSSSLNAPGNSNSPNVNGSIKKLYGIDNALWLDTSAFSAPPNGTFGNVGRFIMSGPGFFNLDASLFKNINFSERFRLELRGEAFSVTNTPQFNNPDTGFGNANFGKIKGAGGNRSVQLGAKLVF